MKLTIEERLRKALAKHPGPWEVEPYTFREWARPDRIRYTIYDRDGDMAETGDERDAEYLRSLRELLSDALDEIEQLRPPVATKQVEP